MNYIFSNGVATGNLSPVDREVKKAGLRIAQRLCQEFLEGISSLGRLASPDSDRTLKYRVGNEERARRSREGAEVEASLGFIEPLRQIVRAADALFATLEEELSHPEGNASSSAPAVTRRRDGGSEWECRKEPHFDSQQQLMALTFGLKCLSQGIEIEQQGFDRVPF